MKTSFSITFLFLVLPYLLLTSTSCQKMDPQPKLPKVVALFKLPGMTSKQYDLTISSLEKSGNGHPRSRLFHVAAPMDSGWLVIDEWESEESLNSFAQTLIPILISNGVNPPNPLVYPLHNRIDGSGLQKTGILALFEISGMTVAQYDAVIKDLKMNGNQHPDGRIAHLAAPMNNGWFVVDQWASVEKFSAFASILIPILVKNGVAPPNPTVMPLYNRLE